MNPAVGPFAIAALLLVAGGALKAWRPHDTALAARGIRLPASEGAVRFSGAAEASLGVAGLLVVSAPVALLVAASYASFFAFVTLALVRRLPISSCGCFGKADTPPSFVHLGVNLGACVAAVAMAIDRGISPIEVVAEQLPESLVFVVLVAVGVLASFVALTVLPRVLASAKVR